MIPGVFTQEAVNAILSRLKETNLEARVLLQFTGINPHSPMRKAIAEDEKTAIRRIFKYLKTVRQSTQCTKCILVGHNAHFDLSFKCFN